MAANVRLSAEEMRLVSDPAWILTKNSIIRKVVEMFGGLSGEWREAGGSKQLDLLLRSEPKISKGEQYKGLPWVMLDYPRVFGKEDVLAVRTMFWWGHYFTVTLHLKGKYLRTYMPVIWRYREDLSRAGFQPGMAEDEWEHEHLPGSWGDPEAWQEIKERPFLKLSAKVDFDQWEKATEVLTEKFGMLAWILIP